MSVGEVIGDSVFFGTAVSLLAFWLGRYLQRRTRLLIFHPLLFSIVFVILFLLACDIPLEDYRKSASYLNYFLTPATVSLGALLYDQIDKLKEHWFAILSGIVGGAVTSACSVLGLCAFFRLSHTDYVTLLPKSITTAIGMGISKELGGVASVTVAVIIATGIIGNLLAEKILRLFRVTDPVARGIGIGSAAHAVGTAKAMEMGAVEGAMSSLSIAVSGLVTVGIAALFAQFY